MFPNLGDSLLLGLVGADESLVAILGKGNPPTCEFVVDAGSGVKFESTIIGIAV